MSAVGTYLDALADAKAMVSKDGENEAACKVDAQSAVLSIRRSVI
jgi:hypothetical protein